MTSTGQPANFPQHPPVARPSRSGQVQQYIKRTGQHALLAVKATVLLSV